MPVNESDWLACKDPVLLLDHLEGKAPERKLRLFACACVRRYWHYLMFPDARKAVEAAERHADGGKVNLTRRRERAEEQAAAAPFLESHVYHAVALLLSDSAMEAARSVSHEIRRQAATDAAQAEMFRSREDRAILEAMTEEGMEHCDLIREVFGNPFRPATLQPGWLSAGDGAARAMARLFYDERSFDQLGYLGDALTDGGCTDEELLGHLARRRGHARGCWALDLVLAAG
jgi:hypothetical protein